MKLDLREPASLCVAMPLIDKKKKTIALFAKNNIVYLTIQKSICEYVFVAGILAIMIGTL